MDADVHQMDAFDTTVLMEASGAGDLELMRLFVDLGVSLDAQTYTGWTALAFAASNGHAASVSFLLEEGASIKVADSSTFTTLWLAAQGGHTDVFRVLVDHGAEVNAMDGDGVTVVMSAASSGHVEAVRFLVNNGASIKVDNQSRSLLMCAAESGDIDMISMAIELGCALDDCDSRGNTALMKAAASGDEQVFRFFIDQGAPVDVTAKTEEGRTLLMDAAEGGNLEIARFLVERGASVNEIDDEKRTMVMLAINSSQMNGYRGTCIQEVVQFFIDCGVSLDAKSTDGRTALMIAIGWENIKLIRFLIDQGASVTEVDTNKWTGLMHAASNYQSRRTDVMGRMLLMAGVDVCEGEQCILIDHGANIDAVDNQGFTALMFAATVGSLDTIRLLLKNNASTDTKSKEGDTALALAAENEQKSVMRELLLHDSELSEVMELVQTATRHRKAEKKAEEAARAQANVLDATLNSIRELSQEMNEATPMCEQLCSRLADVGSQLEAMDDNSAKDPTQVYRQTLGRTRDFFSKYINKQTVTRLINNRSIMGNCRDIHQQIDTLIRRYDLAPDVRVHDWEAQWKEYCTQQQQFIVQSLKRKDLLMSELQDPEAQQEALTLLMFECDKSGSQCNEEELDLIKEIFQYVASLSQLQIPSIPKWSVPPHEVEFKNQSFARGSYGSVHHGTWNGSSVVVKTAFLQDEMSRDMFLQETEIWHQLQHPHVVKLYGACHVGNPFFVCELASNGLLGEYLYRSENQFEKWAKLHEAALGLKYLHTKQKVVHGDLKCNNILIGSDKEATLTDFGLSFVLGNPGKGISSDEVGAIRWKAPEIIRGNTRGTFASDVYAFGMCIIEAVTGRVPWGIMPDAAIKHKVVVLKELPKQPLSMTDEQWQFIQSMYAWEPAQRPDMSAVVEALNDFVELEENKKWDHLEKIEAESEAAPFA